MLLYPDISKMLAAVGLATGFSLMYKTTTYGHDARLLTSQAQVFNHVLETCATDKVISKQDKKIVRLIKLSTTSPLEFCRTSEDEFCRPHVTWNT